MNEKIPAAGAELHQRRNEIFRGLTLINSLNLGVVVLVAALGMTAILLGLKAREDAQKLWSASETQARASRLGGEIGWKSNALGTIARASEVQPSVGLRNEAIAALTTLDLEFVGPWLKDGAELNGIVFSPDLRQSAVKQRDGSINLMELQRGTTLKNLKTPSPAASFVFDQSGKFLGARDIRGGLTVWKLESGEQVLAIKPPANQRTYDTIAFAGEFIAIGLPGGRMQLFSTQSGETNAVRTFETALDFELFVSDATGTKLVGTQGNTVQLWDVPTGKKIQQLTSPGPISSVALTREGKYLAVGSANNKVYLWRTANGEMQELDGHQGLVFRVAFDANDRWLASCAYGGTTRLWEVSSGALALGTESLFIERFAAETNLLACSRIDAGFGLARITDAGLARSIQLPRQSPDNAIYALRFIAPDKVIASRNASAQMVNLESGRIIVEAAGQRVRGGDLNVKEMAIYTSGNDGFLRWPALQPEGEISTNEVVLGPPEKIAVDKGNPNEGFRLSNDGTEALLRIGFEGALLLDLATRKTIAFFPTPNIGSYALSHDKQFVVTGTFHGDGTTVWKRTGERIKKLGERDTDTVFSPDGRWLAMVSSDLCVIYDTTTWEAKHRFAMNSASGLPGLAAFSPDSSLLAFTAMRRTIKFVNVHTGVEFASFAPTRPQQINALAFSPTGERLIAGTQGATLEVWEIAALRQNLAALKLNWADRPRALSAQPREKNNFKWALMLAAITLAVVLCFSVMTWVRHRQFVGLYRQVEQQIQERNRELALAQNELFQSQKMRALGTLAAGIAHDFNNLLSIIRMSNQLTSEATAQNADAQENGKIIERAVSQGKSVVRSMLGYSRTAADVQEFSPPELVERTVGLLRQQFLENVEVCLETVGAIESVVGVPNRLEQVLLNLIVNAVEAMNGSGKLRISTQQLRQPEGELLLRPAEAVSYIEVKLADSGPGMAPEIVARIFEPFFTTKNIGKERGTGLGLSLVYGICKEDGIGIAVKTAPGEGSEFALYVPVRPEKSGMPSERQSASLQA